MSKQLKKVKHNFTRYANCWEDADLLTQALAIQQGDKVLSIGSAGDNSFSLLQNNPEIVVAVDVNLVQLNLIELKKAAFIALEHKNFLEFLGFVDSDNRKSLFSSVKKHLSTELREFWEERFDKIEDGIIHNGKFERYFQAFRKKFLPLIHSKSRIQKLFNTKTQQEQVEFHNKQWNNWRWRFFFKLFFSRFVMGRFGRDKSFMKQVKFSVSSYILKKSKAHLSSQHCQDNYLLEYILKGNFENNLPHYARKKNFESIKKNIDKLVTFHGFAEETFSKYGKFNKFNLSNIFEYMNKDDFHTVTKNLIINAEENAIFVYWNLMVSRRMSVVSKELTYNESLSEEMTKRDNGFFYSHIIIEEKE